VGGVSASRKPDDVRDGVELTNLDQPLFDGAEASKRDLLDYLDALSDRLLPALRDRPLSVVRVRPGQEPFMQKNVPKYAPDWVRTVSITAQRSHREVNYALCDDRRTLLWFGNQRAVEYHVTLVRAEDWDVQTHLVLDLDPPPEADFTAVVAAARLVRRALADTGLTGAVKTSGAKGIHVFVPLDGGPGAADVAAATRALAVRAAALDPDVATTEFVVANRGGKVFLDPTRAIGATVIAAYSPRLRPGVPVSFPVAWSDLDSVRPADFTLRTAPGLLAGADPWTTAMPAAQSLPADLIAQGHTIPVARVQAMHEGKRRAKERREQAEGSTG
jgi:bifunctional non-homologous end joining protein LigD